MESTPPPKRTKRSTPMITQKQYMQAAQVFHWATQEQYNIWFTGSNKRSKRTEVILPRLVKKGALIAIKLDKKLVYACHRKSRRPGYYFKVEHGLGCTEGLVRFWRSDMNAEIIEERHFRGCGSMPEWGLRYDSGKMLMFEYCTDDNFNRSNGLTGKLVAYHKTMVTINQKFHSNGFLVFVCDVSRKRLSSFLARKIPVEIPAFFTDYETFKSVPIGQQLSAPIYLWGEDGLPYPLVNHAQPTHP